MSGHRSVGMQTICQPKNYISPQILSHHKLESDEFPMRVFYWPHTQSMLLACLLFINIGALYASTLSDMDVEFRQKIGVLSGIMMFLAFASA